MLMPNLSDIKMPGQLENGWYLATITDVEVKFWEDGGEFLSVEFTLDGEGEIARAAYNFETDKGERNIPHLKRLKALSVYAGLGDKGEYDPEDLLEKKVGVRVALNKKGYATVYEEADLEDQREWLNQDKAAVDNDVPF